VAVLRYRTSADIPFDIAELNEALSAWQQVYNTVRPHQALNYLTPLQFWRILQNLPERRLGVTNVVDYYNRLTNPIEVTIIRSSHLRTESLPCGGTLYLGESVQNFPSPSLLPEDIALALPRCILVCCLMSCSSPLNNIYFEVTISLSVTIIMRRFEGLTLETVSIYNRQRRRKCMFT